MLSMLLLFFCADQFNLISHFVFFSLILFFIVTSIPASVLFCFVDVSHYKLFSIDTAEFFFHIVCDILYFMGFFLYSQQVGCIKISLLKCFIKSFLEIITTCDIACVR